MIDVTVSPDMAGLSQPAGRRRLAVIVSLLLILMAASSALFLVQSVDSQLGDVVRTYESRSNARQLLLSLTDAESAQRGYLLTGDEAYLEPFTTALGIVDQKYQVLFQTTAQGSVQRARISALGPALEQKRGEMQATIDAVRGGEPNTALATLRTDNGLKLMRSISAVVEAFIADEDVLLVDRNNGFNATRVALAAAIIAGLAGASVLAWVLLSRGRAEVSALAQSRRSLLDQNVELEAHVRERTAELEVARQHAEAERQRVEVLLQDTSHRIGNSLATVSSMLALQMQKASSPEVKLALEAARDRVQAIASGHRRLRLGDDMESTEIGDFLDTVLDDFRATQLEGRPVGIETDIPPTRVRARDATTIATIIAELLTNAVKHAFPDNRPGIIRVSLRREDGVMTLTVADDGVGAAKDAGLGGGLGSLIVAQLSKQYGGTPQQNSRPDGGTEIIVPLPDLQHEDA